MDLFEETVKLQQQLTDLRLEYWQDHVLFSFNWWFLLVQMIVPWFIWWKLVDKTRLKEVLLYGFFIMMIASTLDELGVSFSLWDYRYQLVPVFSRINTVDITVLPFFYMLVYQWFPRWRSFFTAKVLFAAFYAFIGEPLYVWLGIYEMLNWSHVYSFPLYVLIGLAVKWIVERIKSVPGER